MALYGSANEPKTVDAITEDGGTIGGTNDGDMPDLTATYADLTDSSGGTAGATISAVTDTSATDQSGTVNSNFATVNGAVADLAADVDALRAAMRELASGYNTLLDALKRS